MKILFAMPSFYKKDGTLFRKKQRLIIPITLPYLAALTPRNGEIRLVDDHVTPIDTNVNCNLVAMTVLGAGERRAIEVAKVFRKRGIKVVAGGFHASLAPERLQEHVDSVVIGEAENVWEQVLIDAQKGRLQPRYKADSLCSMDGLPMPRFDLLDMRHFRFRYYPIQTTRGCPHGCKFCEVKAVYGGKYRFRPVAEVLDEIKRLPGNKIHVVDDNIGGDTRRAKELFKGMISQKIRWSGLTTFKSLHDDEYVRLAAKSGCFHLNLGIESVNPLSLKEAKKNHNHVDEYKELLGKLDHYKIPYSLNFILGFDGDTPETVDLTIDFCRKVRPHVAFFSLLTPRPGTELMDEMIAQGRIINFSFDQYDWDDVVFRPKNMLPEQLKEGIWRCYGDFYSLPRIIQRFAGLKRTHLYREFFLNLFYWAAVRKRFDPVSFF
ncbi:MAG: radical SAM protein [Verrucomicrobiae bacterium]|nr:radical SAM protein [Verrucomicrobiae bacterium]